MEYKICHLCGEEKELTEKNWFRSRRCTSGFRGPCKACLIKRRIQWNKINKERCIEHSRKFLEKQPYYYIRWREEHRESTRKKKKEQCELLTDGTIIDYLKGVGVTPEHINDELISLKRQQLLLFRHLKKLRRILKYGSINEGVEREQSENGKDTKRQVQ
jgi:hypothetical protein